MSSNQTSLNYANEISYFKKTILQLRKQEINQDSLDKIRLNLKNLLILTTQSELNHREFNNNIEFLQTQYSFLQSQLST